MINAVIFDMDGLLVDSEPAWNRARVELLALHGKTWTEADQLAQAGVHTDVWVGALYDKLGGKLGREQVFDEIVGRMAGYYEGGEVPILPGADEALSACAVRYRVGLASGSPTRLIEACLHGAGWGGFFEGLISSDEVDHGKPAAGRLRRADAAHASRPGGHRGHRGFRGRHQVGQGSRCQGRRRSQPEHRSGPRRAEPC